MFLLNMSNKCTNQTALMHNMICVFVGHFLDNMFDEFVKA